MKLNYIMGAIANDQRVCVVDVEENVIFEGDAQALRRIVRDEISRIDTIASDEATIRFKVR